jgi:hypothetical protein
MAAWELWQQFDRFGEVAWDWYSIDTLHSHDALLKKVATIMDAVHAWRQQAQG